MVNLGGQKKWDEKKYGAGCVTCVDWGGKVLRRLTFRIIESRGEPIKLPDTPLVMTSTRSSATPIGTFMCKTSCSVVVHTNRIYCISPPSKDRFDWRDCD
jgi:hypothetical protein